MLKVFLNHSIVYTLGNILSRGIGILLIPLYTRFLNPTEYGIVDLFMIIGTIINLTIAMEVTHAIARYYQEANSKQEKKEYVSTAFWFTLIVYGIYLIVSLLFIEELTLFVIGELSYKNVYLLATFSIFTSGIFYFTQNQLKWQMQPKNTMIVSVLNVVIVAKMVTILLLFTSLRLESIFIAQSVGNIVAMMLSIYFARYNYSFTFILNKLKEMLTFSYPLLFSSVAVFISMYADRIAIQQILDLEQLGIYAIAFKFASIAGLVMYGFQSSLLPLIIKHYKETDTPRHLIEIFNFFCFFAFIIIFGAITFSKEVVVLFTTEQFYSSYELIPILVLAVFFSNMYIFTPGLWLYKKTKTITKISIFTCILNVLLNYLLIPYLGLIGAAIATFLSSSLNFILYVYQSQKYYYLEFNWIKLATLFLVTIVLACLIQYHLDNIIALNIIIKIVCLFIFIIGILFFFNYDKYLITRFKRIK